ncbi:MAG: UDP-N-acetylglucosamine 2-epimerase (non-hydrolyzing) [Dehalococcoidia bacterium]|jgi:UDP-N-acetylglucosamine 2-epimerase (non-hydrolysing)
MKVLTITGTRPELIRLSIIIEKLDALVDHVLVYTNQNYDYNLSTKFFQDLKIRKPDYYFKRGGGTFGEFFGNAVIEFENILLFEKPNKILVLGDTNSGLLSIVAEKHKIPVYHMEAGNRCYDSRLPEETNRKIIDSVSKYNLPYTENSKQNLLNEGFHKNFVFKTGNPIYEVMNKYKPQIDDSIMLFEWGLQDIKTKKIKDFVLVTAHRCENVDDVDVLRNIVDALNLISNNIEVVVSLHPRTKSKIELFSLKLGDKVTVSQPLGFFDFISLERSARCVITDSGTVQEECCILGVPALTIRESTERQETIECGSNVLCGTKTWNIVEAFNTTMKRSNIWSVPDDYQVCNVSDTVINILLGKV